MDRRTVLAGLAAGAPAALAAVPRPQGQTVRGAGLDHARVLDALRAYIHHELAFWGLPGMTVALVDAAGFGAVLSFGWADVARGVAVNPAHLFQVGSISKSFAAAALLRFADEGRLDLDAPLARYLPDLPLPAGPVTVAQVMSHAAGLPDGAPCFPRVPDGRLWSGFRPGTRFSYSNTGYQLLGLLLARLGGAPHPALLQAGVLAPLGMASARPCISDRDRARYAVGYAPLVASRPFLPHDALAPGPWTDFDQASGAISATSGDMDRYLRFLIAAGRGQATPPLSAAAARRFTAPVIDAPDFGPGARYALGLAVVPVGGRACLHHTGGMLTFSSSLHVDAAAGVGCFASVNAQLGNGYRPRLVTAHAVELMRAAAWATRLPDPPDPGAAARVVDPAALAGGWLAADGTGFELIRRGDGLAVVADGREGRLLRAGDVLATDHPAFADLPFHRAPGGGLWRGETLFARGRPAVPPATVPRVRALAGRYESTDPWVGGMILHARGDRLGVDSANGPVVDGGGTLVDRGGWWSYDDAPDVERLRFEAPVGGRPSRLNVSGVDMVRVELG